MTDRKDPTSAAEKPDSSGFPAASFLNKKRKTGHKMETEAENESFVAKSRPCEGHFAKRDFDSLFGPFFYQKAHSA